MLKIPWEKIFSKWKLYRKKKLYEFIFEPTNRHHDHNSGIFPSYTKYAKKDDHDQWPQLYPRFSQHTSDDLNDDHTLSLN